jgi:DNA-binding transcriptional ArsR family regulator
MAPLDVKQASIILAALAQESRLAVYRLLVQAGPAGMAASKIAEACGIPPSSLSFHLKELTRAGLLKARNESRFVIYSTDFDCMNSLMGFLTENCCGGNPCSPMSPNTCAASI